MKFMIKKAVELKKHPSFKELTNKDICFALLYNYYWVQYPDDCSPWLTYEVIYEHTENPALCIDLIELIYMTRLLEEPFESPAEQSEQGEAEHESTLYGGFDIIVIVSLHGETCDVDGKAFSSKHFKAAAKPISYPYPFVLMEAVPCGIVYFVGDNELSNVRRYIEDLREDEEFLQSLQGRLRELKYEKHSQSEQFHEFEDDPEFTEFHQCTRNFDIVPHTGGYLERMYEYDETEPGLGFNVAYAKAYAEGFKRGDNLMHHLTPIGNKKKPEFSRTQLLTLLRSKGYKMPLIIDLSCGCFDDDTPKSLVKKYKRVAEDRGLCGGKSRSVKRTLKKRRTRKKLNTPVGFSFL
jgi:hypothetical protein